MYNLPEYKEKDHAVIRDFMKAHPFVLLAGADANGIPVATQVPLLIKERDGKLFFHGHIMKQTDHHKAFLQNPHVLAVFMSPHTYVSASWYSNPQQGSTWNYMTVQAKGQLTFLEESSLPGILRETTTLFENNEHSPASFDQIPDEYVQRMVKAIVAFEIEVTALNHVFKLSQNRDEASYHNIIDRLQQGGGQAQYIAEQMKQRTSQLFKPGEAQ